MTSIPGPEPHHHRGRRSLSIRALALTAIAVAMVTTGCIQNTDPRNDSSRIDTHGPHTRASKT